MTQRDFIFVPINDNAENAFGGMHWSMLLFNRSENTFSHYDSMSPSNKRVAASLCSDLAKLFGVSGKFTFQERETPRQQNGYDCGLHSTAAAEYLSKQLTGRENDYAFGAMTNRVASMRSEIAKLIEAKS
jgi:sentrin-specific protease 8